MTTDIVALARRHKHIASHYEGCEADHVGCLVNKLADEVERQRAEIERLTRHVGLLQDKIDAGVSCACAYDDPNEVCLQHSPLLANALAEIERLRAEIERLREALQESACACSSIRECVSECAKDGKCPHLIARNALEGKP